MQLFQPSRHSSLSRGACPVIGRLQVRVCSSAKCFFIIAISFLLSVENKYRSLSPACSMSRYSSPGQEKLDQSELRICSLRRIGKSSNWFWLVEKDRTNKARSSPGNPWEEEDLPRKVLSFPRKGCNWERSFPFQRKVATGKGFINFGKGCNWSRSFPFPGKEHCGKCITSANSK